MRRRAAVAGLLGFAVAAPASAQEGIRVHEEERSYRVTGGTQEEVWESLVRGARREGDDLVFAWTEVSTEYRSRLSRNRRGCRVVGVGVDVRVVVTYPAWTPPRDAPVALRQQWNRYDLAVRRHEEGHVRLARETARRLRETLLGLSAGDCEVLGARGAAAGERALEWGREEQERYDRQTGHGRSQGVRWTIERREQGRVVGALDGGRLRRGGRGGPASTRDFRRAPSAPGGARRAHAGSSSLEEHVTLRRSARRRGIAPYPAPAGALRGARRAGSGVRLAALLVPAGLLAAPAPLTAQEMEERPAPEGWTVRADRGGHAAAAGIRFERMPPGFHITTGPGAILYHSGRTASGSYRVEAETFLFDPGERREGYGILFGGTALDSDDQAYTYFLIRRDGAFLVKRRDGADTAVLEGWTEHPAVVGWEDRPDPEGQAKNVLAVEVGEEEVAFLVNGREVHRLPREGLSTDGVAGLRVNHGLNLHVTRLDISSDESSG